MTMMHEPSGAMARTAQGATDQADDSPRSPARDHF
jgi:hypothetical protein